MPVSPPGPPAGPPAGPATPDLLATWVQARHLPAALPAGPVVVAFDGRSGAGKTTLATAVAAGLAGRGVTAAVVHLDDLYPGWDGLDAVVPLLVEHVLGPLAGTGPVEAPTWEWAAGRPGPRVPLAALGPPRPDVVLLEGAGAGARAAQPWLAGLMWVDADAGVRRRRALARDGDRYAPHWERWAAQEEAYAAREGLPGRAGLLLETDGTGAVVVR